MYRNGILAQVQENDSDPEYFNKLENDLKNSLSLFSHLLQE